MPFIAFFNERSINESRVVSFLKCNDDLIRLMFIYQGGTSFGACYIAMILMGGLGCGGN